MNKRYEVRWADIAEKDLLSIIDFISIENPAVAKEKLNEIKKRASSLNCYPERGRIVPELLSQSIIQYRELIIAPWRIIYRISAKEVYVLTVLDSRRNIEDILLNRFINL